jgi:DNA-binding NtrC family response regulator
LLDREAPDLVIVDVCLPGMSGLDALAAMKSRHPRLPVIVMTGQGTMNTAIEATKRGAFDYHLKPFEPEAMLQTIARALESARLMQRVTLADEAPAEGREVLVGSSAAMQELYKTIGRVAPTDATVLICGESGTGKELVARAIYQHSRRADQPLSVVNCASIPEALLESELFGHERGAFTGAAARRIGKFEQAHRGTLFLDEIGELPLNVQAKFLRALQEKEFQRVGGNEVISSDVRILAATNRNLEQAIAQEAFREDLYHRLNVVKIELPPLRERREDIPLLIEYFLRRMADEMSIPIPGLTDEARRLLETGDWPGNVRELEHCLQRAAILQQGGVIRPADLRLRAVTASAPPASLFASDGPLADMVRGYLDASADQAPFADFLEQIERLLIREALRRTGGNQSRAAKFLGVSRPTLHAKMRRLGL